MAIKTDKDRRFHALSLTVLLAALLLGGLFFGGDIQAGDSLSYRLGLLSRDGLYPAFLALLRGLFSGGEVHLQVAVYLQDMFLALAIWQLCLYLKRAFHLRAWAAWGCVALSLAGVFALSLVSMKRLIMTHCIMTEGLAVPLVLFAARYLLEALLELRLRPLWWSLCFVFPALLLRGQLWFLLVLWLLTGLTVCIRKHVRVGYYALLLGLCLLLGLGGRTGGKLLHLALNGRYVSTQSSNMMLASKLLYLADEEDAALFAEEPEIQTLFIEVMELAASGEYNYRFADSGFFGRMQHYAFCFNDLLYYHVKPQLSRQYGSPSDPDVLIRQNDACGKLLRPLLDAHMGRYIRLTIDSAVLGLIRSNSAIVLNNERSSGILDSSFVRYAGIAWSALLYLGAVLLTVLAFRRDKASRAGWMMLFCIVLLLGNVAPNALAYNVISRYAILGTLPFYLALAMLGFELFRPAARVKPEN